MNAKVYRANDHNLRKQISDLITSSEAAIAALQSDVAALAIQKLRVQTDTSGAYTWTYPVAYAGGVVPILSCGVEGATGVWSPVFTSISNTQAVVQLTRTTVSLIALLGISLLQVTGTPQAFIHLTARAP